MRKQSTTGTTWSFRFSRPFIISLRLDWEVVLAFCRDMISPQMTINWFREGEGALPMQSASILLSSNQELAVVQRIRGEMLNMWGENKWMAILSLQQQKKKKRIIIINYDCQCSFFFLNFTWFNVLNHWLIDFFSSEKCRVLLL